MLINVICVGTKMPAWVTQGYEEYAKRLNKDVKIKLIEIPASKRTRTTTVEKLKLDEATRIHKAMPKNTHLVALDVKGKAWSTEGLAEKMASWQHLGQDISLLVGGPDGLDGSVLNMVHEKWSLSNLTFPHPIVRVVLAEQIYRAWSVLKKHPYHRV